MSSHLVFPNVGAIEASRVIEILFCPDRFSLAFSQTVDGWREGACGDEHVP
jgi:hypothetical protein